MAFGLPGVTGSFILNGSVLGGLVTGSSGEFLALPISSTQLGGFGSDMDTNEWSRFYLSDSFGDASGSVIMALNYLSASLQASSGDVTGPGSSTDNAVVRFDGTGGKTIQNSTLVTFTDAGAFTGGTGGDSYTFSANGQISGTNKVVAGSDVEAPLGNVSGAVSLASAKLTINGVDVATQAGALIAPTTVSGASSLAGAKLTINNVDVATQAGGLVAATTVSGAGALTGQSINVATTVSGAGALQGQNLSVATTVSGAGAGQFGTLTTEEATISVAGVVSGAGAGTFASLTTEEATISVAGAVSGAGLISGKALTIANAVVVSDALALGNVTTISGASSLAGAKLTINGLDMATQAGGLVAGTTVSGAGAVAGQALTTEEATISVAGVISGAGALQGQSLSLGNGAGTISVGGAFVGSTYQGQSFTGASFKAGGGSVSASVDTSVQFSNTASAGGNNYKAAMLISSSDIQAASNAALIPRMVMQGTDDAGALKDFMISVSGGLLQVVELTYGTALPI